MLVSLFPHVVLLKIVLHPSDHCMFRSMLDLIALAHTKSQFVTDVILYETRLR